MVVDYQRYPLTKENSLPLVQNAGVLPHNWRLPSPFKVCLLAEMVLFHNLFMSVCINFKSFLLVIVLSIFKAIGSDMSA